MSQTVSRVALYQLVWSEPLRTLSKRFGISDVALGKQCRAANIPLPGLGYWAKKEAGKPVYQAQLPARALGQSDSVDVGHRQQYGTHADLEAELLNSDPMPPEPFQDGLPEILARAKQVVGKVRLVSSLASPHPVIARLLQDDEKRREKQKALPFASSYYAPIFESGFEKRRLKFLNSLFLGLTKAGGGVWSNGKDGREFGVAIGDVQITFVVGPLKEPRSTYPVPNLLASEKIKLELQWHEPPPEVRLLWSDTEEQTLEGQIEEIGVNLFTYAELRYRHWLQRNYEYRVERKRALEERLRKQQEEEARKERERLKKAAAARRENLIAAAMAWRKALDIRAYVDAQLLKWESEAKEEASEQLRAWAQWARETADEIDPLAVRPGLDEPSCP